MKDRVVLIPHTYPFDHDRASDHLSGLGYEPVFRFPCEGDTLGPLEGDVAGTIVYGGKYAVSDIPDHPFLRDELNWLRQCIDAGLPTVGICQGAQMIAHLLGAHVAPHPEGRYEFGYCEIAPTPEGQDLFGGPLTVPQSHFHAFEIPEGATRLAGSDAFPNQAFRWKDHVFGFQFHPEATPRFIAENWLAHDWGRANAQKPGAQSVDEFERGMPLHEPGVDAWFRGFLTDLFGPAQREGDAQ